MNYKQRADKKRTCCHSQLFCQAVATIPPVMTGDEIADASQKGRGNGESATGVNHLSINQSINQKRIRVTKVTNVTARPLLQC